MARLVTYATSDGVARSGVVRDDGGTPQIIDLHAASGGALPVSLLETLELDGWRDRVDRAIEDGYSVASLDSVQLLAPILRPPKLLAAAANYQAHIDEGGGAKVDASRSTPKLFLKPSSSLIGPDEPLRLPSISKEVDWELELAVVIGTRGFEIPVERALDHVAGYTIVNDISARSVDWGIADRADNHWNGFFDWLNGKWADGFAPMGPWIVTPDEIADPQSLELRLILNGEAVQTGSTAEMIHNCAELITFASRYMTMEPGDVIATGTIAGTGAATGVYLKDGDVMDGELEGIGTLRTPVVGTLG
jgi:2-keto-4-pentenoate hydratase/2-oxohepta-3-ene-1,7-dioic acid hydratase in catechol pathway